MKNERKKFSPSFKTKVALEAVKGLKTVAEIASKYQVHVTQVNAWKKLLLDNADSLFDRKSNKTAPSEEEITAPLYEEIGRLKMDVKWLEKKL
jgi:transposase-like protein